MADFLLRQPSSSRSPILLPVEWPNLDESAYFTCNKLEKQEKFRSRQFKVENYYFKQFSNLVFDLFIFIVAKLEVEQN
jgi:hypothetical protein